MLIFSAANTFFQLNLVIIADSHTRICSGILWKNKLNFRSSHWSCSVTKDVLNNCVDFTGKHLWWRLFFNRLADLWAWKFLKKRLWHRCFPKECAKFLRISILKNICKRLFVKPALSPTLLFLISYTSASNWYLVSQKN